MSILRVANLETQYLKNSNSTLGLTIDSSGRIRQNSPIAFFAYLPTGTTSPANSVIIYNNTYFNAGLAYSTGNGRFTAPVAGYYHFETTAGGTDSFHFDLRKNGSGLRRGERGSSNGGFVWVTVSMVVYLDVNDYVDNYVNLGTLRVDAPYAGFSGHLIG